tara:strand:- start:15 stop:383 length:369 start_codon:yes stop_codon:yes gene_type:complete
MKKILTFIFCIFAFSAIALEKKTNFNEELFMKAQSEGKIVVVSSWIKYCTSCTSQMKAIKKLKEEFNNFEYYTFEVTNREIADLLNVQYQTTLLVFKDNKELHRSIGVTNKDTIYKVIKSLI